MFHKGFLKKAMAATLVVGVGVPLMAGLAEAQNVAAQSSPYRTEPQTINVYGPENGFTYPAGHVLAPMSTEPVDVSLVLSYDGSLSLTDEEYQIQIDVMAGVLSSEMIQEAWFGIAPGRQTGAIRSISMTLVDFGCWADMRIPWVDFRYDDPNLVERLQAFADEIRKLKDNRDSTKSGCTHIGDMLDFVKDVVLPGNPWETRLRTIVDVMSDGKNYKDAGMDSYLEDMDRHRQALAEMGVTINALAIVNEESDLDDYFYDELRTQPEDIPYGSRAMVGNVWAIGRNLKDEGNDEKVVDDLFEEGLEAFYKKIVWETALLDVGPGYTILAELGVSAIPHNVPVLAPR